MENPAPLPSGSPGADPREDKLRHLPAPAVAAFRRFQAEGDASGLDVVTFAILEDYIPRKPERPLAELPPDSRLIDDLGFDSLAITELVFFTEELFGISITNEEILAVHTLDELRVFVRRKATGRAKAA
jgi:acyl carrier protein